jgi:hypothetical protein
VSVPEFSIVMLSSKRAYFFGLLEAFSVSEIGFKSWTSRGWYRAYIYSNSLLTSEVQLMVASCKRAHEGNMRADED